jgi:hypothetical protein
MGPVPLNTPPAGVDDLGYDNRPVSGYSNDFVSFLIRMMYIASSADISSSIDDNFGYGCRRTGIRSRN